MTPMLALSALGRFLLGLLFFLVLAIAAAWAFKAAAWLVMFLLLAATTWLIKQELDAPSMGES